MAVTILGCGYVGTALAQQLQPRRQQWPLRLTTTREERLSSLEELADSALLCDATNPDQLMAALQGSRVAVVSLGPKGDRQVDADGYRRTFVDSLACLKSLLPRLPELEHILYTSSCAVYGDANDGWVDETTPPDPGPGHGSVLLESEEILTGIQDRHVCILRLGALHGPNRTLDARLKGLAGSERPGNGQQFSNWIHLDDAAGALLAAIDGGWTGVVNVVNDEPIRLKDLVHRSLSGKNLAPVRWSGGESQKPRSRRIRNDRLKSLHYRLRHPVVNTQSGVLPLNQVP